MAHELGGFNPEPFCGSLHAVFGIRRETDRNRVEHGSAIHWNTSYSKRIPSVNDFSCLFCYPLVSVDFVSLNSAIPVRFTQVMTDRLRSVSEKTGVPVAQLVRIATENYLGQIESAKSVTIELREKPNSIAAAADAVLGVGKVSYRRKASKKSSVAKGSAPVVLSKP